MIGRSEIIITKEGIVVDIRYLMYHYTGNHKSKILRLADTIEQALHDNGQMI